MATGGIAYLGVRQAILTGQLLPGQRLVEAELAVTFAASRADVRGAIFRLEHEGLVEHERNRGAKVRVVRPAEAIEILQTRALLEGFAARLAAQRLTADGSELLRGLLARMRHLLDGQDLTAASDVTMQIHDSILELAGHPTTRRLVDSLNTHLVRSRYRTMLEPNRPEQSFAEHRAVVLAVLARDPDAAERTMRGHLEQVSQTVQARSLHLLG